MSAASEERSSRVRVVFLLRLRPGSSDAFRDAYETIRWQVAAVPGYLGDQLCQSADDPDQWLITSEWASLAEFLAWESTSGHRELAGPMMAFVTQRSSLRFAVRAATGPVAAVARADQ